MKISTFLAVFALTFMTCEFAQAGLEQDIKRSVLKQVVKRHLPEGRELADMSCTQALDQVALLMGDLGSERGFNSIIDNAGILLATLRVSSEDAYNKLFFTLVNSDDPRRVLENNFIFDDQTLDQCTSYTKFREVLNSAYVGRRK